MAVKPEHPVIIVCERAPGFPHFFIGQDKTDMGFRVEVSFDAEYTDQRIIGILVIFIIIRGTGNINAARIFIIGAQEADSDRAGFTR